MKKQKPVTNLYQFNVTDVFASVHFFFEHRAAEEIKNETKPSPCHLISECFSFTPLGLDQAHKLDYPATKDCLYRGSCQRPRK